eukprot:jgi/Phyca11/103913/e_gw1.8.554.1
MDPYQRTYICTHGWKKRKSRSEGSRPRQHIRLTNCPFRFIVQWNLARGELQVKNGSYLHNHTVSATAYATYPTSRGIADPLVGAHVDGMLAVGAKRSRIYDYLLDHDENVIQSDVDNLVRSHSSSISTLDDNDATAREIALFAAADPENVSSVAETDAGESGVISIATAHMRRVFGRFSELLLVDCSHKTNRFFGEGAVVQQSLIEANGDWHMERAISHFKRSHPTRLQSLRVIIVDKDLNEIRVLEANFPDARVLICHFHVIKYLKEMRAKPEFGKLSAEDASQIDGAVHKMVYALSEDKYSEAHDSLKGICERCGMDAFFAYFEKNWDASRERWVLYLRSTLPHFKNHTNNRLESFFGKLKESVDGSLSMAQCIKSLIAFDRRKEKEYQYRVSRIGQFVNSNYDEEMSNVLRFTTHYVAGQIEHQRLSGVLVKYGDFEKKKPKLKVMKNPVLIQDPFYVLPARLLCEDYPTCRFAGFQSATTKSKRTRNPDEQVVDAAVRDQVIQQASEQDVETVLLPLNFMNFHWCCVTVMVSQKRIFYYDPLNQGPYMNAAKAVASHLKLAGLRGYDVIPQNNPVQFDPFSCGVYVCWMFIRQVCKGVHPDMSKTALNRRRFELFYYLLTGRLLAVEASRVTPNADDDGTEEKLPPPSSDDKINDDEEVPPTQLAQ